MSKKATSVANDERSKALAAALSHCTVAEQVPLHQHHNLILRKIA